MNFIFEKSSGGGGSVGVNVAVGSTVTVTVGDAVWVGLAVIVGLRVGEARATPASVEVCSVDDDAAFSPEHDAWKTMRLAMAMKIILKESLCLFMLDILF